LQEGSMKAFGIATEERDPLMPELQTLKEQGINVVYGLHRGVVLPKGANPEVVKHFESAFKSALDDPEVKKALDEKGTWIVYLNSDDYKKFFEKSYADHEKVAIKIGMYKK
ncbi:MAG: tripartite tricarboxylate transporter substrate-binding protein, partial [Gammaproteobacteria bacterium]|nr:tripartite tricarboxylate transporter substrate-binding protein [Gammaproteobacteria bacterium]